MSDERADAIKLANKVLERPWADPDDDLAMLSRQLLRREELLTWRPIETCPRDGTSFLCGFWAKDWFWITKAFWANGCVDGGWDGARVPMEVEAKFWLPLPPAPPQSETGGKQHG